MKMKINIDESIEEVDQGPRVESNMHTDNIRHPSHSGDTTRKTGRPSSERILYLEGHPARNRICRVQRPLGHKTLIDIVGKFFPKWDPENDERHNFYYASMLTLLSSWRSLDRLKSESQTWKEAFEQFINNSNEDTQRYLSNIQFYYESKNAARYNRNKMNNNESLDKSNEREYERCDGNGIIGNSINFSDEETEVEDDDDEFSKY